MKKNGWKYWKSDENCNPIDTGSSTNSISRNMKKITPGHIITKFFNTSDTEKILKTEEKDKLHILIYEKGSEIKNQNEETKMKITADFCSEATQWGDGRENLWRKIDKSI